MNVSREERDLKFLREDRLERGGGATFSTLSHNLLAGNEEWRYRYERGYYSFLLAADNVVSLDFSSSLSFFFSKYSRSHFLSEY